MQSKKTSASSADLQQSTVGFIAMGFPVRNSIMALALISCCGFREKLWQNWHGAERSTSQWRRRYAPPSPHVNLLDFLLQFADELNIPHSPSFLSETERNSNSKSNMPFFSWRPQWARGNKNGKTCRRRLSPWSLIYMYKISERCGFFMRSPQNELGFSGRKCSSQGKPPQN